MFNKKILALFASFLCGCAVSFPLGGPTRPLEETVVSGEGKDKVLIIDISGIISDKRKSGPLRLAEGPSMVARVKEELEKARKDNNVKALVLRINSPGGTVTASDIIYHEVKHFKEDRPVKVVACIMGLGTSGGYYVASSADKIVAHPTCVTGSIGVFLMKVNMKGLMDKIGVENETVKSGDKKDLILPFRSMTAEERQVLQGVIDSLQERFITVVEGSRPGVELRQKKELTDGRVFTAQDALSLKLVDKVGYLEDAIEMAKAEAGIKEARVVVYRRPPGYKNNIYSLGEESPEMNLVNIELGSMGEYLSPDFMYLWMP